MRRVCLTVLALLVACSKPAAEGSSTNSSNEACPHDLLAARGSPCTSDGQLCSAQPAGFTHLLACSRGVWTEMDAPPPPSPSR